MTQRSVHFLGNTRTILRKFPEVVKDRMGYALYEAQQGKKASNAKPLKGFHGTSVLEVVEDHDGNTYRAVYTLRFASAIYVLHVFQKKSKKGIATPRQDIDLIKSRLKLAEDDCRKESES